MRINNPKKDITSVFQFLLSPIKQKPVTTTRSTWYFLKGLKDDGIELGLERKPSWISGSNKGESLWFFFFLLSVGWWMLDGYVHIYIDRRIEGAREGCGFPTG